MKTSQLVAIILMDSLPGLYLSHEGLKLPEKIHPFDVDHRHAVHKNQHLRSDPGSFFSRKSRVNAQTNCKHCATKEIEKI